MLTNIFRAGRIVYFWGAPYFDMQSLMLRVLALVKLHNAIL